MMMTTKLNVVPVLPDGDGGVGGGGGGGGNGSNGTPTGTDTDTDTNNHNNTTTTNTNNNDNDDNNYSRRRHRLLMVKDNNKLYDLTEFVGRHPGGAEVLYKHRGQDLGPLMSSDDINYHKHSPAAYRILEKYCIGSYSSEKSVTEQDKTTEQNNDLVDWDKPILDQLDQLGDKYFEWVHQPEEHHIRLFHSNFCEFFSMAPWWLVPLIWIPVTCLGMYYAYQNISTHSEMLHLPYVQGGIEIKVQHLPLLYLIGLLQWTLLEYLIHRWLFHLRPINSPIFIRMHFVLHGQHHKAPMDKTRLVFPPVPASMFAFFIYKLLNMFLPAGIAQSLFAGTVTGYLIYDLIHYYLHHGTPAMNYFKDLKHYHMLHHYVHQHSGFGISSKFWDYPFGTLICTKQKKVSP